jgi:hypothetical protein
MLMSMLSLLRKNMEHLKNILLNFKLFKQKKKKDYEDLMKRVLLKFMIFLKKKLFN